MGRAACTEPQCLYSIAIPLLPLWAVRSVQSLSACTVQLYLYSPYGPYGLYRASVAVQCCTLPFFFLRDAAPRIIIYSCLVIFYLPKNKKDPWGRFFFLFAYFVNSKEGVWFREIFQSGKGFHRRKVRRTLT